jgi:hypothetical protein
VLRKGAEIDLNVPTVSGDDGETDRFVLWAGALLHAPHRAVRQQAKTLHSLVYISGNECPISRSDVQLEVVARRRINSD